MTVYEKSRYVLTKSYLCRGVKAIKLREKANIGTANATYYTVIQGDTIDGISYKQYGTASYWWAIMDANPQYQHELDIKAGDILTIPALEEIERLQ